MDPSYNNLFNKFKKFHINKNFENEHITRDKIYTKFIKDIANNKFNNSDIIKYSNYITTNIINIKTTIWYA